MKELGKLVNLHESTVKRYEDGEIKALDIAKIKEFARVLRVSPIFLLGWDETDEYTNSIMIPVYGSIPAGVALEAIEDIQGYEDIPDDWLKGNKEFLAVKSNNDRMYTKFLDWDVIIIQKQQD